MKRFTKSSLCDLLLDAPKIALGDIHRCETCNVMCLTVWDLDVPYEFLAIYEPDTKAVTVVSLNISEVILKVTDKGYLHYATDEDACGLSDAAKQKFNSIYTQMKSLWEAGK